MEHTPMSLEMGWWALRTGTVQLLPISICMRCDCTGYRIFLQKLAHLWIEGWIEGISRYSLLMERVTDLVSEKKTGSRFRSIERGHSKTWAGRHVWSRSRCTFQTIKRSKCTFRKTTDPDAVVKVLECSNSRVNFCRADQRCPHKFTINMKRYG
jgi:hypothetical protein